MFTWVWKGFGARLDQMEHILNDYLGAHRQELITLETNLKAQFAADLAAQRATLTQQFNTALAQLEQNISSLQKQVSQKGGASIRTEEQEAEWYSEQVKKYNKQISDKIPS